MSVMLLSILALYILAPLASSTDMPYVLEECQVASLNNLSSDGSTETTAKDSTVECTPALAQFALDELITGESQGAASKSNAEHGYSVQPQFLTEREILLCPLPKHATLQSHQMQAINVREALEVKGLTAENIDLNQKEHRQIVGKVLLQEMEALFDMKTFHIADTSRVDGGAVYGEATVRDTASQTLRKAHHSFHIDKFLPGICVLYDCSSDSEAVSMIVNGQVGHWWVEDMKRENVTASQVEQAMLSGHKLNVWISLTPGIIEQSPLVLVDPKTIRLSHESFYTMKVHMPGLEETLSLLKVKQSETAKFHWIPEMQFGDILIFSNSKTPHSAVRVLNGSTKPRQSAEMRMILLDDSTVN